MFRLQENKCFLQYFILQTYSLIYRIFLFLSQLKGLSNPPNLCEFELLCSAYLLILYRVDYRQVVVLLTVTTKCAKIKSECQSHYQSYTFIITCNQYFTSWWDWDIFCIDWSALNSDLNKTEYFVKIPWPAFIGEKFKVDSIFWLIFSFLFVSLCFCPFQWLSSFPPLCLSHFLGN